MRRMIAPLVAAVAAACGSNGPTSPVIYQSIAGTYVGSMSGTSQGILLQANFTLTVTQSEGTLGGSYSLTGSLTDGVNTVSLSGGGTLAGSIAAGSNPSVNVTTTSGICPSVQTAFSGAYDSVNRVVTLRGTIPVYNASCQVVLTYPNSVLVLTR